MKRFVSVCLTIMVVVVLALTTMVYTSCSPEPQTPQNNNQGGGGGGGAGTPQVTISGVISNYSSGWKPFVVNSSGTYTNIGSVASSGNPRPYTNVVAGNLGSATVGIFKDLNDNNQIDSGEKKFSVSTNIGTSDLVVNFAVTVQITGVISNYSSGWKPFVISSHLAYTNVGSVASSGNPRPYTNIVPQNLGWVRVGIFNDIDNDGVIDDTEIRVNTSILSVSSDDITVNHTIPPLFHITGTLTGSPTPQWKVFANVSGSIVYGTVDPTFVYMISNIPSNSFVYTVKAFKDDDNDGIYDFGEYIVDSGLPFFVMVSNITNNIDIPNLQNMPLTVVVSNNAYNLKVGVRVYLTPSGASYQASSKNDTHFVDTFSISGTINDTLTIDLYYDVNGDGDYDFGMGYSEPFINLAYGIPFSTTAYTNVVHLVPHTVTGIVEQLNGASGFKPLLLYNYSPAGFGSITGNSYKIHFYSYPSYSGGGPLEINVLMFRDVNNNNILEYNSEEIVYYGNTPWIPAGMVHTDEPSTNAGHNIYVKKVPINIHLTGTDADKFKYLSGSTYTSFPLNREVYFDTNSTYQISFSALVDLNENNIQDPFEMFGSALFGLSNQNSISITQEVIKFVVTNTIITNDPNSLSPGAFFYCKGSFIGSSSVLSMNTNIVSTNMILTLYSTKSIVVGNTTNGVVSLELINSSITNTNNSTSSISITNTGNTNLGIIWMD